MTDRAEIEAALEDIAKNFLAEMGGRNAMPGWAIMFRHDVQFETIGMATIPTLPDTSLVLLLDLAESNPHAYDAASYLAAMQIAAGLALPIPRRLFAGQALAGEIERPTQKGRPLADDVILRVYQYMLAVFTHKHGVLSLSRNDASETFSACDAVAEAFTRAGRNTTFAAMKSLCYDLQFSNIRALGAWLNNQHFLDVGRNLKFPDLEK